MTTTTSTSTSTEPTPPPLAASRWVPTDAPTPILVDLFPALVTLPAGATQGNPDITQTITKARLLVTADPTPGIPTTPNRVYVFVDSTAGPSILFTAAISPTPAPEQNAASQSTFTNREGTIPIQAGDLTYQKDSGCGCGSALKSFAPFTHPYSVG